MDSEWKPVRDDESQYAEIRYRYEGEDPNEPPAYEAYYDQFGKPCQSTYGCYARAMTYGGPHHHLLYSEEFLDVDGGPATSIETGAHLAVYSYNGSEQTSARYYDIAGNPFTSYYGYATLLREYNKAGRLLWEATLDEKGHLTAAGGRYAAQVHRYDYADHQIAEKYFGSDGSALTQIDGYATVYYDYDLDGNIIATSWLNAADQPVNVNGAARVERMYDEKHNVVYEAFFGADGKPVLVGGGYAARRMTYDEQSGLNSSITNLDEKGNPVVIDQGYASFEQRYDRTGNLLFKAYYNEKNQPVFVASEGYARFERKLDTAGNMLEEAWYDADGSLIVNPER